MPKSRSKKKYKKKKNPNRVPQGQTRSAAQSTPAQSGQSAPSGKSAPMSPKQRQQMWLAIGIAALVFLLLIWVANLSNKNKQAEETASEAETVENADAVTEDAADEGESDADETADEGESAEAAADAEADESATEGDTAAATEGDTDAAATEGDTAATGAADAGTSDAAAETSADATDNGASATETAATSATDNGASAATDNGTTTAPDSASTEQTATDTRNVAAQAVAAQDNGKSDDGKSDADDATETAALQSADADAKTSAQYADIIVQNYGAITVELDPTAAPKTVENFVKLVKERFYNGLTFHRIMDGFMIQGGDPNGNGTGGSGTNITGEFESNGFKNDLSHVRGVISMARAKDDKDSASSQFFIVQTDSAFLDGDYAAFGHVTSGMDIVDKICKDAKPTDTNGTIKPDEQPVIESIVIREA